MLSAEFPDVVVPAVLFSPVVSASGYVISSWLSDIESWLSAESTFLSLSQAAVIKLIASTKARVKDNLLNLVFKEIPSYRILSINYIIIADNSGK